MDTSVARADIDYGPHATAYAQTSAQLEGALIKIDAGVASLAVPPDLLPSIQLGNPKRADFTPKPIPSLEDPVQISDASIQRLVSALETTTTIFSGSAAAGQNADRILARLIVQLSALLAKGELDERLNKRQIAKIELLESASETRKGAGEEKRATLITSIATITASVVAIGMSGMYAVGSMKTMFGGLGSGKNATNPVQSRASSISGSRSDGDVGATPQRMSSVDNTADDLQVPRNTVPGQPPENQTQVTPARRESVAANVDMADPTPTPVGQVTPTVGQNQTLVTNTAAIDQNPPQLTNTAASDQRPMPVTDQARVDHTPSTAPNTAAANQTAAISDMSMSQQRTTFGIMGVQTFSQLGPAVGGAAAMNSAEQAKLDEADSKAITAQAEETKGEGDMSAEMRQSLFEMIKALLEFCKEMNAARVSKMASIKG